MVSDVLGQPIGPFFEFEAVKEECWEQVDALLCRSHVSCDCFSGTVRDCSTLQDGLDRLP